MNAQLSTTDYQAIANYIYANRPDENKAFEVEYETADYVIFLDVRYDFDTTEVIGGSYEGWDFERLTEVCNENFDVVSCDVFDTEGEPIEVAVNLSTIEKFLN